MTENISKENEIEIGLELIYQKMQVVLEMLQDKKSKTPQVQG